MMMLTRLRHVPRWFFSVLIAALILLVLAAIFARAAVSAPKASSAEQCQVVTDMAVTAAALAIEGVDRARAERIMPRMYVLGQDNALAILKALLDTVYRDKPDPEIFATVLLQTCMRTRGNMDSVLGEDS